jgi:hypothetical protein
MLPYFCNENLSRYGYNIRLLSETLIIMKSVCHLSVMTSGCIGAVAVIGLDPSKDSPDTVTLFLRLLSDVRHEGQETVFFLEVQSQGCLHVGHRILIASFCIIITDIILLAKGVRQQLKSIAIFPQINC